LSVNQTILIAVPGKKEKQPLSITHPELAKEADGWDPKSITRGHDKKKAWKCKLGHTWEAVPYSRTGVNKRGCPFCAGKSVWKGFNDLETLFPSIAVEAFGWDPSLVTPGSKKIMEWKCPKGHLYKSACHQRTGSTKGGCSVCAGKSVSAGFNDLASIHPELATQAFGWDPSLISKGSKKKLKWKCNLGHLFEAIVCDRTGKHKSGCPVCSQQELLIGVNDLFTIDPELAKEAFGWDPKQVIAGGKIKRKWKCSKEHVFENSVYARISERKSSCPYCSNQKVLKGFNDLATTHPRIASQLVNADPTKIIAGSRKIYEWNCPKGHTYKSAVGFRTSTLETGCNICAGKVVLTGFNDLQSQYPAIARDADGWDPSKESPGAHKKQSWICIEGHKWKTTINSRVSQGSGCPTCSVTGFDPNKDGYFYFIMHSQWEMLQIGITNYPDDRLKKHKKLGWEQVEIRGPMDGHLTQQWETAILRMLKAKGADLSNSKIAGKFDGYSEAWSKSTFEVKLIKELMKMTEEFEEKNM